MTLQNNIIALQRSPVRQKIEQRLDEFSSFGSKSSKEWFSELCFCLLTANSKAKTALAIQAQLGPHGFCNATHEDVRRCIIDNKHRFHNNKASFIIEARQYLDIKEKVQGLIKDNGEQGAREWLVKNIKGLGLKEASHFLRNTGAQDLAIVDRHIMNLMVENKMLKEKPKSVARKSYFEIECTLRDLASKLNMSLAELDMYMWYMKTGEVLK